MHINSADFKSTMILFANSSKNALEIAPNKVVIWLGRELRRIHKTGLSTIGGFLGFGALCLCIFLFNKYIQTSKPSDANNSFSSLKLLDLNEDVLGHACSYLDNLSSVSLIVTCKQTSKLFERQILQKQLTLNFGFGPQDWKRYFGDIGEVPPLPNNVAEILKTSCPFWKGKKVGETHMLTLIPKTIDGEPLNFNLLEKLIQDPKEKTGTTLTYFSLHLKRQLENTEVAAPYWVLMTKYIIPNSKNKTYEEQTQLVQKQGADDYKLPSATEAALSILMHYFKTGKCCYNPNEHCYNYAFRDFTRCQEVLTEVNQSAVIGCFDCVILEIIGWDRSPAFHIGVAPIRKF